MLKAKESRKVPCASFPEARHSLTYPAYLYNPLLPYVEPVAVEPVAVVPVLPHLANNHHLHDILQYRPRPNYISPNPVAEWQFDND